MRLNRLRIEEQKGLQQTLKEHGFNVGHLCAKCAPVCLFENNDCCMAHILSKQDDFATQISMLKSVIQEAGHKCIFLPKFHCKLNPIEMVSPIFPHQLTHFMSSTSIVLGVG